MPFRNIRPQAVNQCVDSECHLASFSIVRRREDGPGSALRSEQGCHKGTMDGRPLNTHATDVLRPWFALGALEWIGAGARALARARNHGGYSRTHKHAHKR